MPFLVINKSCKTENFSFSLKVALVSCGLALEHHKLFPQDFIGNIKSAVYGLENHSSPRCTDFMPNNNSKRKEVCLV